MKLTGVLIALSFCVLVARAFEDAEVEGQIQEIANEATDGELMNDREKRSGKKYRCRYNRDCCCTRKKCRHCRYPYGYGYGYCWYNSQCVCKRGYCTKW